MDTLVEAAVAETLRTGGDEEVRLYVAACAERTVPLFLGMRAGAPDRQADLDLCVESLQGLWCADRALPDAAERVRALEGFPELRPREGAITDVAGTYAFFGVLVLRYALLANASAEAGHALSCGHAALTAVGLLDQSLPGGSVFRAEEEALQKRSLSGDVAGLWEASVASGRERLRAAVGRLPR
ncbi:hypothetical protein DEJ51_04390 [Streptomyces venezuelae]|uniref:Uncharacterized protein n=1 Tax=Streptomyces venezuelae TaxID=54571 RepID=A0A5P2DEJ7_STRVZ|nr:hypothetical protein [Streptomyces venezuelae]QES53585.1 hypothetical protein DEJ51_04390 [Streptomyces venezuelae]